MTKFAEQLKQGADQAWESLAEGWRELSARASGALTRLLPGLAPDPKKSEEQSGDTEDELPLTFGGWAFMAADVHSDSDKVVVRLEAPGMRREDFSIDVHRDVLVVRGEKRSDRVVKSGSHSLAQCAYGRFSRTLALPAVVRADEAKATYRDGVLRLEIPKAEASRTRRIAIRTA